MEVLRRQWLIPQLGGNEFEIGLGSVTVGGEHYALG